MPTYCYTDKSGCLIERVFRMGKAPTSIFMDDGRVFDRDFSAEHKPRNAGAGWPMVCFASGVNANQAGELREFFAKNGENIEVTSGGDPVYTSPAQRKRLLKLRGFHDRNSYC